MAASVQPVQPKADVNEQMGAEFYSSIANSYEAAFGHDEGLSRFLKTLLTHLPPQANVLDVGCGTGRPVAATLAAAGHNVSGIDISDEMVKLSRKAVPAGKFEVADMLTYTPPAGTKFDVVMAILSLFAFGRETLESQIARLGGFVGKDGLLCVCSIPAEDGNLVEKSNGYDEDGLCVRDVRMQFMGDEVPITLFTRRGWHELLKKNGFEIVDTIDEMFVPPKESKCDEEMHHFMIARKLR